MSYFDEEEKMYSFSKEKETGVNTIGRFANIKAKWRINNTHWNSPIDYHSEHGRKLIAVIGDSYIEAFQVDISESYPFLLREKLKNDYEVYAFGKSGAPLSQYLHISRYVNKHFDPEILIFNLVHNDFDESIQELSPRFYFLQVSVKEGDSISETMPRPKYSSAQYQPWKRLVYRSALLRYLYFNLQLSLKITDLRQSLLARKPPNHEANIMVDSVKKNKALIFKATNYLVETIRKENMDKRVVFVIDAPRKAIYDNQLDASKVLWMHEMMEMICLQNNVELVDLTPFMLEDYRKYKNKFNSSVDNHWNEYGHKFVARVLNENVFK